MIIMDFKALKYGNTVLPIFIYDTNITNKLEENDHRLKFISDAIKEMNSKLHSTNNKIFTFKGKPSDVLSQLIKKYKIKAIFFNKDYEPYARERDQDIIKMCDKKVFHVTHLKIMWFLKKMKLSKMMEHRMLYTHLTQKMVRKI